MSGRQTLDDFAAGLAAPWRGLAFLARRSDTWSLALVPAFVGCVLLVTVGGLLMHLAFASVAAAMHGASGLVASAVRLFVDALAAVVCLGVALYASLTLASPLSSRALERLVSMHDQTAGAAPYPQTDWSTSASRALGAALMGVAVGAPAALVVAIVDVAIPAAAVVMVPIGALISGYVIAWNLLDYPFGLRAVSLVERGRWMRSQAALVTGFALSSSVLLFVPGLGLLLLPAGVVGAAKIVERGGLSWVPPPE